MKTFQNLIKGLTGHPLSHATLIHYSSKKIVYNFNKANSIYPLLTKTEYLLKSLFLSMYSLISRPTYLIKQDKIIIRLFVYLSPKADKYLDTSTLFKGITKDTYTQTRRGTLTLRRLLLRRFSKFLKFKSLRPKAVEILKTQIKLQTTTFLLRLVQPGAAFSCSPKGEAALPLVKEGLPFSPKGGKAKKQLWRMDYK